MTSKEKIMLIDVLNKVIETERKLDTKTITEEAATKLLFRTLQKLLKNE